MQETNQRFSAVRFHSSRTPQWVAVALVSVMIGCRNTTNAPMSAFGGGSAMSPLSPVQGAATLSPIQPTSGISNLGAPTRVPPPPTGSYNSPGGYGAPSSYTAPSSGFAPSGGFTPSSGFTPSGGSNPNLGFNPTSGFTPSGATLGSNGLTRGVTQLNPAGSPGQSFDSGVRQTGWVGDASGGGATFGRGFNAGSGTIDDGDTAPTAPPMQPRSGGMQVIDLTQSPYPPGYVPPQNRPGVGYVPQSVPYPQAAPVAPLNPLPSNPGFSNGNSAGQPRQASFVRSASGSPATVGFDSVSAVGASAGTESVLLPSTEPFPAQGNGGGDDLQWRRPSPRF